MHVSQPKFPIEAILSVVKRTNIPYDILQLSQIWAKQNGTYVEQKQQYLWFGLGKSLAASTAALFFKKYGRNSSKNTLNIMHCKLSQLLIR